jgi:hypothetical protein
MSTAGWTISVIAIVIVFAILFRAMRSQHPEDKASHQAADEPEPRQSGGVDRPAGPGAEAMQPDLRGTDQGPPASTRSPDEG